MASGEHEIEWTGSLSSPAVPSAGVLSIDAREAQIGNLDLAGRTLCESNLDEVEVTDARLARADFGGSRFRRCVFRGCDLSGVDFASCFMSEVEFLACKLSYANFFEASLKQVLIKGGLMRDARFASSRFVATRFSDVDVAGSSFNHITLAGARDLDLRGSNLEDTNGVPGIRGVLIDEAQASLVGQALLAEQGIVVEPAPLDQ